MIESSDYLFHFTPKLEYLKNILKEGFFPRFNLEHTFLGYGYERPSTFRPIPMVCFCDIPFSRIKKHRKRYGRYGIGLTKEWGAKAKLNPVVYINKDSNLGQALADLNNTICSYDSSMFKNPKEHIDVIRIIGNIAQASNFISNYFKQYENKEELKIGIGSSVATYEKKVFYDEKEWRHVPIINNSFEEEPIWITHEECLSDSVREQKNKELEIHPLKFTWADIKYIIVSTENQKRIMLNYLKEIGKETKHIKVTDDNTG